MEASDIITNFRQSGFSLTPTIDGKIDVYPVSKLTEFERKIIIAVRFELLEQLNSEVESVFSILNDPVSQNQPEGLEEARHNNRLASEDGWIHPPPSSSETVIPNEVTEDIPDDLEDDLHRIQTVMATSIIASCHKRKINFYLNGDGSLVVDGASEQDCAELQPYHPQIIARLNP